VSLLRTTIKDVCDKAGVSVGTVSNVVNAPHLVADETRRKVLRAIEDLHYRPSRAARSLQAQRTHLIGYRLPDPVDASSALDVFLHRLVGSAAGHGLDLVLFAPRPGQSDLDAYREVIRGAGVDGFVLSETNYDDPRVGMLIELAFPFVAFGRANSPSPFPWVDVDGATGVASVVAHLVALGHQSIGLVGWPEGSESGDARAAGFIRSMEAAGLGLDRSLFVRTENSMAHGRMAGRVLLDRHDPPSAIVTVQDELAFGVMTAVAEAGLTVGKEVAVAGFDDTPPASVVWPGLTSVRQPFDAIGRTLVDLLVARLEDPARPPQTVLLEPELITRASTTGSRR